VGDVNALLQKKNEVESGNHDMLRLVLEYDPLIIYSFLLIEIPHHTNMAHPSTPKTP
jgi:hypothetical protein